VKVLALLIIADLDQFNRSRRMAYDIAFIMQQVIDLPSTSRDQLTGTLIMNHINNENLAEGVHMRNNYLGYSVMSVKPKLEASTRRLDVFISVLEMSYL
jgi:hypothetical protein